MSHSQMVTSKCDAAKATLMRQSKLMCCLVQVMRMKRSINIRFIKAYKMMLDFYGFQLSNVETGYVVHASNWKERLYHLNW